MKGIKIGNVKIDVPTFLAPMKAVNCEAFMRLCDEFGCGCVATQALSDEREIYNFKKLRNVIDSKLAVQLMLSNTKKIPSIMDMCEKHIDIIDFNMGCPQKEVLGSKMGGYLMTLPNVAEKIVRPLIENYTKPVSVKIRLGFDKTRENYMDVIRRMEKLGVDAVTVHGRYVREGYSGNANIEKIKKAHEEFSIPIIANGDINKIGHVKSIIERDYADGLMIGREVRNNPHFFSQMRDEILFGRKGKDITFKELLGKFFSYYMDQKNKSIHQLKDHLRWMCRGDEGKKLFFKINLVESYDDIKNIIENL